jgi:hypothetical protein
MEINKEALERLSIADLHQSILFLGHGYQVYHTIDIIDYKKMQDILSVEIVRRLNDIFIG